MKTGFLRKIILIFFIYALGLAFLEVGLNLYLKNKLAASLSSPVRPEKNELEARSLVLLANDRKIQVNAKTVLSWIEEFERDFYQRKEKRLAPDKVAKFIEQLSPRLKMSPVNTVFEFDGENIKEFSLGQIGQELDIENSAIEIIRAVINEKDEVNFLMKEIEPEITLSKIKALGINTLLSKGESDFSGSPDSRIFNIKFGSAKYNSLFIQPQEKFSFNSYLGEVDEKSGFLSEKVVKGNRIIYEAGGGICQVSTTFFRAAILAGLPIKERRPHSLPVRYYNPQGFDATVYPGVTDLKFVNDTNAPILVQTKIIGTNLYFELYGAKTDREVIVKGPFNDIKEDGSIKASFTREIKTISGDVKKEVFYSSYKSPSLFITERNPLE